MVDVFVRCWAESRFRAYLAAAVVNRLAMFGGTIRSRLILVAGSMKNQIPESEYPIVIGRDDFAKRSHEVAEVMARSEVYVLLDDDHLPIGKDWVEKGVAALIGRPEFVMLSSWSINGEVKDWEESRIPNDPEVFEVASCGTPCFVRRGTFVYLPDGPAAEYDQILSAHLRMRGKIGFLRNVRHNHLGCGFSQVVPEHWRA